MEVGEAVSHTVRKREASSQGANEGDDVLRAFLGMARLTEEIQGKRPQSQGGVSPCVVLQAPEREDGVRRIGTCQHDAEGVADVRLVKVLSEHLARVFPLTTGMGDLVGTQLRIHGLDDSQYFFQPLEATGHQVGGPEEVKDEPI
jgi:hypothetical protein